ncbi:hypothetical protein ACHAPJ_000420 [Fusarium lateritium]
MTRKTLRILCFGDSLTSGYFSHGMDSHPYALKLEDRLTGTFPEVDFEIVVDGVPGDVASFNRFYDRLDAAWKKQSYDWTIVLGGTNYSFDLHSKIPYHSLSDEDRYRYWDDGLHLRDEGYNWMGNHIADALIDILWREGTFEQPTSSKTADPSDVIVEDEFTFDEEDGNPRNLNEGYVVVRKKDLD